MAHYRKSESKVCWPTDKVVAACHTMMSASGLIVALNADYDRTGIFTPGALKYIGTMIDHVIEELGMDRLPVEQEDLPF